MIFPIWAIYTFSIKSCCSYLNIFSILPPIISVYRLTIATLYKHLRIKYIEITYNVAYKGSLYFAIPDVSDSAHGRHATNKMSSHIRHKFTYLKYA